MKRHPEPDSLPTPQSKHSRQDIPSPSNYWLKFLREVLKEELQLTTSETTDGELHSTSLDKIHAAVRAAVISLPETIEEKFVKKEVFRMNIQNQQAHIIQLVRTIMEKSAGEDDVHEERALFTHDVFWTSPPRRTALFETPALVVPMESQIEAIVNSWTAAFVDQSPVDGLRGHIVQLLESEILKKTTTQTYGRYCSLVQSSGMGKSRLVDEFSKMFFLIPMNLRATTDQGFPPADDNVSSYLTAARSPQSTLVLIKHFLIALFNETKEILKEEGMGLTPSERIAKFREYMSKGQTMGSPGTNRVEFYDRVITEARRNPNDSSDSTQIAIALEELRKVLNSDTKDQSDHCIGISSTSNTYEGRFVDVFIAFDESHTLAAPFRDDRRQSPFAVLRHILRSLSSTPLFSFFLSTTGKITQSGQPRDRDPSTRIDDGALATLRPYIRIGFDQLMQNQKILGRWRTLDEVTSLECVAHMGRPLWGTRYDHGNEEIRRTLLDFAIIKLLCGHLVKNHEFTKAQIYAVLSQRLALDINMPQYLLNSASPLDAMEIMHEQIANHMRVCVAVGDGMESLRGITSSEPILSEAASVIMSSETFSLPRALSLTLTGFSISQGDRGELLVAAFFTWARDQVVHPKRTDIQPCRYFSVNELFQELFSDSTSIMGDLPSLCHTTKPLPFGEVFGKAKMHFNHVVKPQAQMLLARRFLLYYMARGAAVLGANCQPGVDAVYPYLYDSDHLDVNGENVGFIMVQVKNDPKITRSHYNEIFQKMNPFDCGLLDDSDKVSGRFPIPIIRILFSLCNREPPGVTCMNYEEEKETLESVRKSKRKEVLFTSYDYVCTGISPKVVRAVGECSETWEGMLDMSEQWRRFYDGPAGGVLRAQMPGCGDQQAHFSSWLDATVFAT